MCVSPYITNRKDGSLVAVSCGHCLECLKDYQQQWTFRLVQECKGKLPIFVTLTYDDEHLPVKVDEKDGIVKSYLVKRDLQLFIKRFRKLVSKFNISFRYFAVGEYGKNYNRCHYHILIISDYIFTANQVKRFVERCWDKGFIQCKVASRKQISYLCKYVNKIDDRPHIIKPFRLMSKSIGLNYLTDKMIKYYFKTFDKKAYYNGGKSIPLPRYYCKKLDEFSQNYFSFKRSGLVFTEVLYLNQDSSKYFGKALIYSYFCQDYESVYSKIYHDEVALCRLNGWLIPDTLSYNEVFARFRDSVTELRECYKMNINKLNSIKIHGNLSRLSDYVISRAVLIT